MKITTIIFLFLYLVFTTIASPIAKSPTANAIKFCPWDFWVIIIVNHIKDPIHVHIKSEDDDLGDHILALYQNEKWSFCENVWKSTMFYADFIWNGKTALFGVFDKNVVKHCSKYSLRKPRAHRARRFMKGFPQYIYDVECIPQVHRRCPVSNKFPSSTDQHGYCFHANKFESFFTQLPLASASELTCKDYAETNQFGLFATSTAQITMPLPLRELTVQGDFMKGFPQYIYDVECIPQVHRRCPVSNKFPSSTDQHGYCFHANKFESFFTQLPLASASELTCKDYAETNQFGLFATSTAQITMPLPLREFPQFKK
ncbi:plant self-incompatibility S1 [Artemisia annua]|uniref:Plant self-incompatibility S1 n=1 Tax=Artemisia annua TaxID=35608 RepID=A0A2U1Q8V1_ARTAN|nr:plant self-incompatibility S1 [Artemisia annua]